MHAAGEHGELAHSCCSTPRRLVSPLPLAHPPTAQLRATTIINIMQQEVRQRKGPRAQAARSSFLLPARTLPPAPINTLLAQPWQHAAHQQHQRSRHHHQRHSTPTAAFSAARWVAEGMLGKNRVGGGFQIRHLDSLSVVDCPRGQSGWWPYKDETYGDEFMLVRDGSLYTNRMLRTLVVQKYASCTITE
jgi:hypothetical protein